MVDKLMYIPKITSSVCRLELRLDTFEHSALWTNQSKFNIKFPKLLSKQTRKRYYKTLRKCVINSPKSPSSLIRSNIYFCIYLCLGFWKSPSKYWMFHVLLQFWKKNNFLITRYVVFTNFSYKTIFKILD